MIGKKILTPLEMAMKILAVRPHAEFELVQKLQKKNLSAPMIKDCIAECKRYGFINDEIFAKDYSQILLARGCGKYLIKQKLKALQISSELIDNAIENLDDEYEQAKKSFDYKMRLLAKEKDLRKKREKIYRFLISRGFSFDIIKNVMDDFK